MVVGIVAAVIFALLGVATAIFVVAGVSEAEPQFAAPTLTTSPAAASEVRTVTVQRRTGGPGSRRSIPRRTSPRPSSAAPSTPPARPGPPAVASSAGDKAEIRSTLQRYWSLLEQGNYEQAFSAIAPGRQNRAGWLADQRADALSSASLSIGGVSVSGSSATAQVTNLRTDASSGCFNWQGAYQMVEIGGDWLIDKADISKSSC